MPSESPVNLIIGCVLIFLTSPGMDQYLHTTHIKIWGVRLYIINERVTRNNLDDRLYRSYFILYASTTVFIIYWKPYQTFVINRDYHVGLMNMIVGSMYKTRTLQVIYSFNKILKFFLTIQTHSA